MARQSERERERENTFWLKPFWLKPRVVQGRPPRQKRAWNPDGLEGKCERGPAIALTAEFAELHVYLPGVLPGDIGGFGAERRPRAGGERGTLTTATT